MKSILLIASLVSFSALAADQLLYTCQSEDGVRFEVYRTERTGGLMVEVEAPANVNSSYGYFCFGKFSESNKTINIHDRAEIIGEDPSKCTFDLNKKKLKATYTFKQYRGYVRTIFTKPEIDVTVNARCEKAE